MGGQHRRLPREGPGLTRLSSSGLEEKRGLSERTWEEERDRGGPSCPLPAPPRWPSWYTADGGAHLLGKGSDVLIEGIGGADVTALGCPQRGPSPIAGRARGQFTFLKDQGQQWEERVSGGKRERRELMRGGQGVAKYEATRKGTGDPAGRDGETD